MADKAKVVEVILAAVKEMNEELEPEKRLLVSADTVLSGQPSRLTSLDLVNLIVLAEEKLSDAFKTSVVLADEKAMSQKHSPFRNVTTLTDYVVRVLEEKGV